MRVRVCGGRGDILLLLTHHKHFSDTYDSLVHNHPCVLNSSTQVKACPEGSELIPGLPTGAASPSSLLALGFRRRFAASGRSAPASRALNGLSCTNRLAGAEWWGTGARAGWGRSRPSHREEGLGPSTPPLGGGVGEGGF